MHFPDRIRKTIRIRIHNTGRPVKVKERALTAGRTFYKNLRSSLFNDDLLNELNFGWIHLAGQYL
jgi:hypothetical protein